MADKTITELPELTSGDNETVLPVDDGIQSYKMSIDNLLKSAQSVLAVSSTTRDSLVPEAGWEIFNTTLLCKQVYTGSVWINIGPQTGDIVDTGRTSAAPGFLACDGASYLRSAYPELFAAIGTAFGSADGTHFNVPLASRKTRIGSGGTGTGVIDNTIGSTGGEETHTLSSGEMPAHSHSFSGNTDATGLTVYSDAGSGGSGQTVAWNSGHVHNAPIDVVGPPSHSHSYSGGTNNTGGGGAHNVMQPSLVVGVYIKF